MLSRIRGVIALIQFTITVGITIILMYLFNKKHHKIRKAWTTLQIKLLGIKLEVIGKPDSNADMIIMNHQSLLDIVVMEYLHPRNLAWVGKKEISNIFFFGHIMKAPKMISIERENRSGMVTLLKEAKDRLDDGRPIAMFPEGTRSNGDTIRNFKAGAKILATKYDLKVQPIVMFNTNSVLDSKTLKATPGIVKVVFLDTIETLEEGWFEKAEEEMKDIFYKEKSK